MKLFASIIGLAVLVAGILSAAQLAPAPADMVRVEGGTFAMGSTLDDGRSDDKPVHQVTVSSFWMAKYEVTQAEYKAVMGNNPSRFVGDNRPVEQVSWLDAINYCNKRSQREGLTPVYSRSGAEYVCNFDANGYRLPIEAEWEYAAKGGAVVVNDLVPDNFTAFAGSPNLDTVAWYDANSGGCTHPVGQKQPNQLGLYDMSGNVNEWCWDWFGNYESGAVTNPRGASSGSLRVRRGGDWNNNPAIARVTERCYISPGYRASNVGFRVVRSL